MRIIYLFIFLSIVAIIAMNLTANSKEKTDKKKVGFLKMLFGKNTLSDNDRKHIAKIGKPILYSIKWLQPLTQFVSGATFGFFIASRVINNFTQLDPIYSIGISTIIGLIGGLLVEGGLSVFLTPFWQSLIHFKFTNRIPFFLFCFIALLVVGFGSITTVGSRYASPELVDLVSNDSTTIDVSDISNIMLSPIQSLISSQDATVLSIKNSRSQGREALVKKWDSKIKADDNWAKKTGVKNYVSSYRAKKQKELSFYDANTTKSIQTASSQNLSSIERLTDNATSTLSTVSELKKSEVIEKKERKGNYSFIVMCIVIFSTIATISFVAIKQMVIIGGGKYIKETNDNILDDLDETDKTDEDTDNVVNQTIINYVSEYLDDNVSTDSKTGLLVMTTKSKELIYKWLNRGSSDRSSDNWKKFVEAKRQLKLDGIETITNGTKLRFEVNGKKI